MAKKASETPSNLVSDGKVVASIVPLFGDVVLNMPDGDPAVYPGRGDSGPSTVAMDFSVPLHMVGGHALTVANRVYARLQADGGLKIDVSLPQRVKASKEYRDAFKTHVLGAIAAWPYYDKACSDAWATLTNPPKAKAKGDKVTSAAPLAWVPKPQAVDSDDAASAA